jgi:hypothetical protein
MPTPDFYSVNAEVIFPNNKVFSFHDTLKTFSHHRGFGQTASYVVAEISHTSIDIMTEFMNFSQFTFRYGYNDFYIPDTVMEVFSVDNETLNPTTVKTKIVGIEPGYMRLQETSKIRSFPNQTISAVMSQVARETSLKTSVVPTIGTYTFVQPNVSDLVFLTQYLLPIATDGKSAPFLFTLDRGKLYLKPPALTSKPLRIFILDPTKDNTVRKATFRNVGMQRDVSVGKAYTTYSYNFRQKGTLIREETLDSLVDIKLNKKLYDSNFFRINTLPYEEEWMLKAYNRNKLGRSQFAIILDAMVTGEVGYDFDQIVQLEIPLYFQEGKSEYSGFYYIYNMSSVLAPHTFVTHLDLRSNAFLRAEKTTLSPTARGNTTHTSSNQIT